MEEKIINAVSEPLKSIGVSVYSVTFEKEDGIDTLFIKIEGNDAVDTDLCVKASEIINPIIDKLDLTELGDFVLDICSKGDIDNEQ